MLAATAAETATETATETDTDTLLAQDDTYTTWCDAHRDAWIADLDATNDR